MRFVVGLKCGMLKRSKPSAGAGVGDLAQVVEVVAVARVGDHDPRGVDAVRR